MDFSLLVEAEEEPDGPLVNAAIFRGSETEMEFSLITDENGCGNDPLELPTSTSPEKGVAMELHGVAETVEVVKVKEKAQSHRSQPQTRPVRIVRLMPTRRSQPPFTFRSKAHFQAEMDKNVRDVIGESITLLKMDPRQYHPFYLRIFKYVTLGQVHGFIGRSVEDKWRIWGQYDNEAKEHFERWKEKSTSSSSSTVKIKFSGEMSPYASFVLHGTATVNGKEILNDSTYKEGREMKLRDLEETAKRICEEAGEDVDIRDDLPTRLKFFQYCQTVTFPGDCVRMNEIWGKLLDRFGKSTSSKSQYYDDVPIPYFGDDQEDRMPSSDDILDQKPPIITLMPPPPSPKVSSENKAGTVRAGNSKSLSKTERNAKKLDVDAKVEVKRLNNKESKSSSKNSQKIERKISLIVKKSELSTLKAKPSLTNKVVTTKSNKAKVSPVLLREYQWRLEKEERRKQNLLKWTQAQVTSSTKMKKLRLERIKQSLSEKLGTKRISENQKLKTKAKNVTSASTGKATSTSSSTSSKSRSTLKKKATTKRQREKWQARFGEKSPCPICGKMYTQSEALWQHYKFDHLLRSPADEIEAKRQPNPSSSRKGIFCEICGMIFSGEPQNLNRHMLNIHGIGETREESLQCPHCGKTYKTKDSLNVHIRQIHQGEDVRCDICNRNCQSAGKLWRHKTEDHNITDLPLPPGRTVSQCEICGEKTLRSLIVHVRKKHPERVAEFQETERIRRKRKSKTSTSPTRYEQTLERAKLRKRKNREMIRQLGSEEAIRRGLAPQYMRRRKCHVCQKEFVANNYAKHMRLIHGIKDVPLESQANNDIPIETHFLLQNDSQNSAIKSLPTLTWELNELIEKRKLAKILFGHVSKYSNGKVFICSFCPDVQSTILDVIRKHLISVHPESLALEEVPPHPPKPQSPQVPPSTTPLVKKTEPQCPHCSVTFRGEDDLLKHAEVAHPNLCLRCPECSKLLISPEAMTLHFAQAHVDNKGNSIGDEEEQVGNGNVKVQQFAEGDVAYFKIEYVHKRTPRLPSDPESDPVCKRCVPTTAFKTKSELFQHVKHSHPENFFPCGVPNCGVTKFSLRGLLQHYLSFHKSLPKSECDPRLESLRHYRDMRGYCPICGTNLRVTSMDKHIRLFHRAGPDNELSKADKEKLKNRLLCQLCNRRFYNGYHLLTHAEEDHEHQLNLQLLVREVLGLDHAAGPGRRRPRHQAKKKPEVKKVLGHAQATSAPRRRPGRQPKKKPEETECSPKLRRSGRAKKARFVNDDDDEVDVEVEEEQASKRKKRVNVQGQKPHQSEKRGRGEMSKMPATKPCFVKVEKLHTLLHK